MSQYPIIFKKVSEMIADAKDLDPESLTPDSSLWEIDLDSLDYVELMVLAKREFNVTLDAEVFNKNPFMTLEDLCQRIHDERMN